MTRTIEITVATDGQTRVETRGFSGAGCREASRFIETALGKRTEEHWGNSKQTSNGPEATQI